MGSRTRETGTQASGFTQVLKRWRGDLKTISGNPTIETIPPQGFLHGVALMACSPGPMAPDSEHCPPDAEGEGPGPAVSPSATDAQVPPGPPHSPPGPSRFALDQMAKGRRRDHEQRGAGEASVEEPPNRGEVSGPVLSSARAPGSTAAPPGRSGRSPDWCPGRRSCWPPGRGRPGGRAPPARQAPGARPPASRAGGWC